MEPVGTQIRTVRLIALRALGLGFVVLLIAVGAQWMVYHRYRLIGEMNHHIRNALQEIALDEASTNIREAVQRIDWTLHEVLPGLIPTRGDIGRSGAAHVRLHVADQDPDQDRLGGQPSARGVD